MQEDQRAARIFGVLFIITFVTSIPALALYQPVLDDPAKYIAGGGHDNEIYFAAFLELFLEHVEEVVLLDAFDDLLLVVERNVRGDGAGQAHRLHLFLVRHGERR